MIVEKAPALRTGGYVIDFWGAGFGIAERMGLLPEIRAAGYDVQEVRAVNAVGRTVARIPAGVFAEVMEGQYTSVPRGELAAILYRSIDGQVETIFGDGIAAIDQDNAAVRVTLESGAEREFDLVVGADGLHSRVRELVFPDANRVRQGEHYLGYKAAAFELPGYEPRDELVYLMHTEVGQQVARFSMREGRTMFLFTFADAEFEIPKDVAGQKALLRARFGRSGWECPAILQRLDEAEQFYFDRVSQVRLNAWSKGRVVLVGDAASCVSLLAGQGSSLAMTAAYLLAGELHRAEGHYADALVRYERRFRSFVEKKQKTALRYASSFAPASQLQLWMRNAVMNLFQIGPLARWAARRDFADHIELPEY